MISKAAVFGFIRICFAKFPGPFDDLRNVILALAAVGLVYGSLLAFRAPDVRGVIAYSSLAQMGLITIGVFADSTIGISGAILQAVNHGLISAALFLLAGIDRAPDHAPGASTDSAAWHAAGQRSRPCSW